MKIDEDHHLTYCTNIHAGETWSNVFESLKKFIPKISNSIAPNLPFGIGLRLSDVASRQILEGDNLQDFKSWLQKKNYYIFTFNGFPFGGFHRQVVKDEVHQPDWTTESRLNYTKRLFKILEVLLPEGQEGGISTSPLSYKLWFQEDDEKLKETFQKSTLHLAEVALQLYQTRKKTGKFMHLDIEPEPDGLLENSTEFIQYYNNWLIPVGTEFLKKELKISAQEAEQCLKDHIQLCYDVCHFAIEYEEPREVFSKMEKENIKIGKVQISAALKFEFSDNQNEQKKVKKAFESLVEPTYLHQVIVKNENGGFQQYNDLPAALINFEKTDTQEWRTHFHVPIFVKNYGVLTSTQDEILKVISILKEKNITTHLEVETYTWEVLPEQIKLNLADSITRELKWVKNQFAENE